MVVSVHRPKGLSAKYALNRQALIQGALLLLSVIFLMPLYWLVSSSLKTDAQIQAWPPVWVPDPVTIKQYTAALQAIPFWRMLANTLFVAGAVVIGTVLSCS